MVKEGDFVDFGIAFDLDLTKTSGCGEWHFDSLPSLREVLIEDFEIVDESGDLKIPFCGDEDFMKDFIRELCSSDLRGEIFECEIFSSAILINGIVDLQIEDIVIRIIPCVIAGEVQTVEDIAVFPVENDRFSDEEEIISVVGGNGIFDLEEIGFQDLVTWDGDCISVPETNSVIAEPYGSVVDTCDGSEIDASVISWEKCFCHRVGRVGSDDSESVVFCEDEDSLEFRDDSGDGVIEGEELKRRPCVRVPLNGEIEE